MIMEIVPRTGQLLTDLSYVVKNTFNLLAYHMYLKYSFQLAENKRAGEEKCEMLRLNLEHKRKMKALEYEQHKKAEEERRRQEEKGRKITELNEKINRLKEECQEGYKRCSKYMPNLILFAVLIVLAIILCFGTAQYWIQLVVGCVMIYILYTLRGDYDAFVNKKYGLEMKERELQYAYERLTTIEREL